MLAQCPPALSSPMSQAVLHQVMSLLVGCSSCVYTGHRIQCTPGTSTVPVVLRAAACCGMIFPAGGAESPTTHVTRRHISMILTPPK